MALGGVLAAVAVHLVQLLGLGVPRLEVVVGQRPRGGDPIHVPQFGEVTRAQPVQRRTVEFGGAADEVVHLRLERLAVLVEPGVLGNVFPVDEDGLRIPVARLAGQEVPAFQKQDSLPRAGQGVGKRPAACPGPDNDHVKVLSHGSLLLPLVMLKSRPGHSITHKGDVQIS